MNRRAVAFLLALALALLTSSAPAFAVAAAPTPPPGTPTATRFPGVAFVGPIFAHGLGDPHTCTASVVHSPKHDLLLTAAHCVSGSGAGLLFVPGYRDGVAPYGVWRVQRAWVSPRWIRSQDPHDDVAFLQVAPHTRGGQRLDIQQLTGGSYLGVAAPTGTTVTDIAYPYGVNDRPIRCTNRLASTAGYPTFDCHGYPGGTSGSPFLVERRGHTPVSVGAIGGLHQGGCYEWNSFSSPFGRDTVATYVRAAHDRAPDTVPSAGGDGC